jgi:hypothetical protein
LDLVWTFTIREVVRCFQDTALTLIEPTRRDVVVLSLDLEPSTPSRYAPDFNTAEESPTDTLAASGRRDPDVPQGSQIATTFQHGDVRSIEGNDGAPNSLGSSVMLISIRRL